MLSDKEYQEYVQHQQTLYDVEDTTAEKQAALTQAAYEQLQKDYQTLRQEVVYERTLREQAEKNCQKTEKTLNDVISEFDTRKEQIKEWAIEVPCKTLYGLAFDWQEKPGSVFVILDRDTGDVKLLTSQEFEARLDGPRKPTYRHWWNVKVADVKAGQNISGGINF